MIIDPLSKLFSGDFSMVTVNEYEEEHEITRNFKLPTLFPVSQPIIPEKERADNKIQLTPLAFTDIDSWAETEYKKEKFEFNPENDIQGPIPVAVAIDYKSDKRKSGSGRMVIIGDSDFISNSFLRFSGNRDFFLNIINWLAQEEELISIRPKATKIPTIHITQRVGTFFFYSTMVALPIIILIIGGFIFFKRRYS
jgi:ABC-type uncharacterized transport system involved in gliding motility auxiliary subunit